MQMVQTRTSASPVDPVDLNTPPPPPPPAATADQGMSQFMAAQTQLMNSMMQNMNQMMNQQNQTATALLAMMNQNNQAAAMPPPPPTFQQSKFAEFMRTHPPTFSSSPEPLDADDWLRSIAKKLALTRCDDRDKVLYATHQLEGTAAEWWENYCAAHENPQDITWAEFSMAYRHSHVPDGIVEIRRTSYASYNKGPCQ